MCTKWNYTWICSCVLFGLYMLLLSTWLITTWFSPPLLISRVRISNCIGLFYHFLVCQLQTWSKGIKSRFCKIKIYNPEISGRLNNIRWRIIQDPIILDGFPEYVPPVRRFSLVQNHLYSVIASVLSNFIRTFWIILQKIHINRLGLNIRRRYYSYVCEVSNHPQIKSNANSLLNGHFIWHLN